MRLRIDDNWEFTSVWDDAFLQDGKAEKSVRIPHTVKEVPLHYIDPESYQMICGYRRNLFIPSSLKGQKLFLTFDAAAHIATLYFNGQQLLVHKNGYTAFTADITDLAEYDKENRITVKLDTTENPSVPPFGFVIDYLTFGGIYRHVWFEAKPSVYISDVFVKTPDLHTVEADITMSAHQVMPVSAELCDPEGNVLKTMKSDNRDSIRITYDEAKPWSPESPVLYLLKIRCGEDEKTVRFGFRTYEFDENHFILNGKEYFIRGLNRHQSFPYVGYAASDSLQREDVRILKEELCVNAVRTSHYPQSHEFIDACDEMGLLVFTELPGWQHIGDRFWKTQALENLREMILQYRNHTSIFLWGVRINESVDDDEFYLAANVLAHRLDPTRKTSGVRYLEKSSFLEDVYAYNDFSHSGKNAGVRRKKDVVTDMRKPMLISEANGHMFPTKSWDSWEKRQEHALRHARVLNDAMEDGEHAGCFQWCMFDYPTHKDFGSGDRICYHGVTDSFRNPKTAAALYASQEDERPVLEVGSSMDIGVYPGGQIDQVYVFTNADEVRLYKNDQFVKSFSGSEYRSLKHGPVLIDDTIGCLLQTQENLEGRKEQLIHEALLAAGKYGMPNLPVKYKMMLAWCMLHYEMKYEDGVELYGKYVGSWGGDSVEWRFDAVKNGEVVASAVKSPRTKLHFETKVSSAQLQESDTYDMAAVRIRIVDELNNLSPYAQLPVRLQIEGEAEIVGPGIITAEGGMCGTYIRTTGKSGEAVLTVSAEGLPSETIRFCVNKEMEK